MLFDLYFHHQNSAPSSGMRRLMMYQLQEESLQKDQKRHIKEAAQAATEKIVKVETKKPREKLEPLVPLETYEVPDFKRKAIYTRPTKVEPIPFYLAQLDDVQGWYADLHPLWVQFKLQVVVPRVEAANDHDMRIRLLLLAA